MRYLLAASLVLIKAGTNGFVWEWDRQGSAIFAYLGGTQAQFENTVAHNCYHIGFSTIQHRQDSLFAGASPPVTMVLEMLGDFGEGHAVLAAAGGPSRHPRWPGDSAARARWDFAMGHFSADLLDLQAFFLDVLDGKLTGDSAIRGRRSAFSGPDGPWYTVGYRMDVLVERHFGRAALIRATVDPRVLLVLYDRAAGEQDAGQAGRLSVWSPTLLSRIGATDALADAALKKAAADTGR